MHKSESVESLEAQVLQHVDAGATGIVVAGGGGSVHEAVNGVMRSSVHAAIGVIPMGTGNDFTKACDIPLNWEHACQFLAERIATISNGPWVGGMFHIAPMANNADGILDLMIAKPVSCRRIMSLLPRATYAGRGYRSPECCVVDDYCR